VQTPCCNSLAQAAAHNAKISNYRLQLADIYRNAGFLGEIPTFFVRKPTTKYTTQNPLLSAGYTCFPSFTIEIA
jgi:hypothetical protein